MTASYLAAAFDDGAELLVEEFLDRLQVGSAVSGIAYKWDRPTSGVGFSGIGLSGIGCKWDQLQEGSVISGIGYKWDRLYVGSAVRSRS